LASFLHYLAAPGVVVVLMPWLLTGWEPGSPGWPVALRWFGAAFVVGGVGVVTAEFVRFVREGGGSPAPIAPTERLVTGGLYRYVRNPMYVGVVSAIVGQGVVLSSPIVLGYAGIVFLTVATFVQVYEEPTLSSTYGAEYSAYCRRVPRWIPRLTPIQR
jgi:protein-S-isoprenylcysteine O-methyltransferase Ste14